MDDHPHAHAPAEPRSPRRRREGPPTPRAFAAVLKTESLELVQRSAKARERHICTSVLCFLRAHLEHRPGGNRPCEDASVVSVVKLSPGQEAYYAQSVAAGVEDYYAGRGEAPGIWHGRGAEQLGLVGVVSPEQLRAIVRAVDPVTGVDRKSVV